MKRYILTGTPGSGKSSILESLDKIGYSCIKEAATEIIRIEQEKGIKSPWLEEDFIDKIVDLQKNYQLENSQPIMFFDRSPICTYALALYLKRSPTPRLLEEIEYILAGNIYEKKVFFIENLGFITNTAARTISFEEALEFEKFHVAAYKKFGFELINIPPVSVDERTNIILNNIK